MIPPLSGETGDAVGRALDLLRIRLLADAATHQQAANHPPTTPRCHTAGTSPRRGTAA
ncbi:hypothetical protein [Cryptosporangium arvum]|uniref:Uncharacterized protein n=1 Tax=Cryptosporangium arvum DSM 44712 TaxID=927661 RepID=A0A011AE44_9ACTN|nr:hypothetical protein [Cryptosporangium arvum]EXG80296.1 hypothetical protein CryarDRAFT_1365 [Cryptosporangium arvum DSM 44712]